MSARSPHGILQRRLTSGQLGERTSGNRGAERLALLADRVNRPPGHLCAVTTRSFPERYGRDGSRTSFGSPRDRTHVARRPHRRKGDAPLGDGMGFLDARSGAPLPSYGPRDAEAEMTMNRHTARVADLVLPFPGGHRRPPPRRSAGSGPVIGGASGTEHADGVDDAVHRAAATIRSSTLDDPVANDDRKGQMEMSIPGQ